MGTISAIILTILFNEGGNLKPSDIISYISDNSNEYIERTIAKEMDNLLDESKIPQEGNEENIETYISEEKTEDLENDEIELDLNHEPLIKEENLDPISDNNSITQKKSEIEIKTENHIDNTPEVNNPITLSEENSDSNITENNTDKKTDLFDLDKSEFEIDDLAVENSEDEIIIKTDKKTESDNIVDNIDTAESEISDKKIQADTTSIEDSKETKTEEIVESDIIDKNLEKIPKTPSYSPKIKEPLSYLERKKLGILNQRQYDPMNIHLDKVAFEEEYYQMFFAAIEKGNLSAIDVLFSKIGHNIKMEVRGQPPLIYAVNKGNITVIRKLLSLGFDPDVLDSNGNAAIHLAIMFNRVDILTELLLWNANATMPNREHKRPIALALDANDFRMVDILNKAGATSVKSHQSFKDYLRTRQSVN